MNLNSNNLKEKLDQGKKAFQAGNFLLADKLFTELVSNSPFNPQLLHFGGLAKSQLGKHQEGIQLLQRAIQKYPHPMFYNNLGLIQQKLNKNEDARKSYEYAIKLAPDFKDASLNLAKTLLKLNQNSKAKKILLSLYKLNSKDFQVVINLGICCIQEGKDTEAETYLEEAKSLTPDNPKVWHNLGLVKDRLEKHDEAIDNYRKTISLNPGNLEIALSLLYMLRNYRNKEESDQFHHQLIRDHKSDEWLHFLLNILGPRIFENNHTIDKQLEKLSLTIEESIKKPPPFSPTVINTYKVMAPFEFPYAGRNVSYYRKLFANFFNSYLKKVRKNDFRNNLSPIPKVGFVVTEKHEGVFLKCMKGILNRWDANKFQTSIICCVPHGPAIIKKNIENPNINIVAIPSKIELAYEIIKAEEFDFLYYWEIGTDHMNYFLPLLRPAPIQCTSWGWPVTSGMPTVDYFISSSKLDSNESRHHYTENLVLLEHLPFCYDEPEVPEEMLSRAELGISTELKLYAVIQNILKIHPDMDDVFDQILSNDNSGALVIIGSDKKGKHEALKARLKPLFTKYPDRIFLLERQASVGYFSIIRHAHIILDTFYYNAGANTNADVLACNKPFVTHEWDQHRGRFSAGVYNQMQIENAPIATSKEEYIELALKLANDEKYRLHIEHQIESNKDLFFNTIEAVSDLENFVQKAIQDAFPRKSFDKSNVKKKLTQEIPKPISVKTLASVSIPELLVKMDNSLLTKDFIEVEKTGWEVLEKDPYNKSAADKLLIISDLKSDLDLANKVRKLGIPELENDAIDIFRKALYVPTFPSSSEAQAYLDLAISQLNEIDLNEDFEMENLKFFNFSSIWKTLHYGVPLREFKIAFAHAVMKNLPPFRYKRKRFERDKIRIGYLVTKDHHAIFIKSMSGIIHKMDKDRFEIVVIADEINLFEIEEQFRDNVLIYKSLSDDIRANIAEIYDLELDILHYWEVGTDSLNYFLPFFRLAHKQCTSWGVPSTSGIPTIDSYITFQYMEIPEAESQYTEKLVVVNSLPSVFWEGQAIEESAFSALDLPTGKNIYTCTQRLSKFQPIMDEVCKGILEKDEHGIIVLIEDKNEFLTEKVKNRLEKIIPNYKDKIFMVPRLDPMRYKSLLKNAKVYLDTAYYSGANTTIDAITNDLPIVFFKGNNQRSLCTYAIFRHMDIEPIQCDTVVEYVTEATRLVLDQEYRKISINEVRENKHKIFEQLSVVKEYEKAYSSIHNSD